MAEAETATKRLESLDVFRGGTVAAMMIVNNPGSWDHVYPPLLHAEWDGWTFTDTIFPFFLFIVGVAMTFSFAKRLERGDDRGRLLRHAVKRSAVIFALGLFLAGFPRFDLQTWRIPGVLQRISLCYLAASAIVLWGRPRATLVWAAGLLAVYWLAVFLVPVPGYGPGVLAPTGSLCWYVDSTLLAGHTWRGAPVPGFDPEGIVSTIPAVASVLLGVVFGRLLRSKRTEAEKTALMLLAGNGLMLSGVVASWWLPINKNLWTSSYSLFMAGLGGVVLAACYWAIDVQEYRRWARPFAIYGMNAITVFFLSGILGRFVAAKVVIYESLFEPLASPKNASLLYALSFMLALYGLAWVMHRRGWIVKA